MKSYKKKILEYTASAVIINLLLYFNDLFSIKQALVWLPIVALVVFLIDLIRFPEHFQ